MQTLILNIATLILYITHLVSCMMMHLSAPSGGSRAKEGFGEVGWVEPWGASGVPGLSLIAMLDVPVMECEVSVRVRWVLCDGNVHS